MAKESFVPPPEEHPQNFIVDLASFLVEEEFETATEAFMKANASKVTQSSAEEEQSLESFAVYQDYLVLVESKLEGYLERKGMSGEEFQLKCLEAQNADDSAFNFMDALIAGWDYDKFLEIVTAWRADQIKEEDDVDVEAEETRDRKRDRAEDDDFSAFT